MPRRSALRRTRVVPVALALAVIGVATIGVPPAPADDAAYPDPLGYCNAESAHLDPRDTERAAPPVILPPGFKRREVTLQGYRIPLIVRGPRRAKETVVFFHGNPGTSEDFAALYRAVPRGVRVVAPDLLGFGEADKPFDFPFDLPRTQALIDDFFEKLRIRRMHLVGHDLGGGVGLDWAARRPRRLESAVLIATGALIGYEDHQYARVWKQPIQGEALMAAVTRETFHDALQSSTPRPLPREFVDRNYDSFDRGTRCAILRIYRNVPDFSALGERWAKSLRPHDVPALAIWGDSDPFVPEHLAHRQREAFPSVKLHIYERSGHWPFVDEEKRTVRLIRRFLRNRLR